MPAFPAQLQSLVHSLVNGFDPAAGHQACCGAWTGFPDDASIGNAMADYWASVPGSTPHQVDAIRSFPPDDLIALKQRMVPIRQQALGEYQDSCGIEGPRPLPWPRPPIQPPIFDAVTGDTPGIEFRNLPDGSLHVRFRAPQIP